MSYLQLKGTVYAQVMSEVRTAQQRTAFNDWLLARVKGYTNRSFWQYYRVWVEAHGLMDDIGEAS